MAVSDHVAVADEHERGRGDRLQRLRRDVRLRDHQAEQFFFSLRLAVEKGDQGDEAVAEADRELDAQLDAGRGEVGAVENQPVDAAGVFERKEQGDVAAVAESEQIGALDALGIEQGFEIVAELFERERSGSARGAAVTARIDGEDAAGLGEVVDLMDEVVRAFAVAVQQHQRRAVAGFADVERDIHASSSPFMAG